MISYLSRLVYKVAEAELSKDYRNFRGVQEEIKKIETLLEDPDIVQDEMSSKLIADLENKRSLIEDKIKSRELEIYDFYALEYDEARGCESDLMESELEDRLVKLGWTETDLELLKIASDSTHPKAKHWKDVYPEKK